MSETLQDRFQNLHEFIKAARTNLNRNVWDYLIGASETETTVARNRLALDSLGFRPRVLCDVSEIDCSTSLFGRKLRIPVLLAPVGSLESFEPGGGTTVAKAATEFGNGMILSCVSHPGLEATAEASGAGFKIFQLYVLGDADWVDDHFLRAIDAGYDAFCVTVDTDRYSRRERDIAKRYQRRGVVVRNDARVFQARHSWRDVERCKAKFAIPLILKGIATAEDARRAVELGVDCVYVSNHGGRREGARHRRRRHQPRHRCGQGDDPGCRRGRGRPALCLWPRGGRRFRHRAPARDPPTRDHDLPRSPRRHRIRGPRQIVHLPGAAGRHAARAQRLSAPRPAARNVLTAPPDCSCIRLHLTSPPLLLL